MGIGREMPRDMWSSHPLKLGYPSSSHVGTVCSIISWNTSACRLTADPYPGKFDNKPHNSN